mgnify:CR=1 FL=1
MIYEIIFSMAFLYSFFVKFGENNASCLFLPGFREGLQDLISFSNSAIAFFASLVSPFAVI